MGFLDNVFTEEEFDDYRYLERNILHEADDDEDAANDDTDESNFDMPDDDEPAEDNNQPQPDQPNPQPANGPELPQGAEPETVDDPGESNFDMPDDGGEANDNPEPANEPAPANEPPQNDNQHTGDDTGDMHQNQGADAGGDATMGDDPDESNFDLPDEPGEGGGDGQGADAGGDGSTTDGGGNTNTAGDTDTEDEGTDPDQNIRDAEGEIFANLSDKDKINKVNELKTLYEDLYNRIVTLHDKVNNIPKDDDLIKVYNFVTDNLADMKEYVYDYMTSTFDNKTYLENMINYKKYLSTLNVINGILEEIRKGLYKADK